MHQVEPVFLFETVIFLRSGSVTVSEPRLKREPHSPPHSFFPPVVTQKCLKHASSSSLLTKLAIYNLSPPKCFRC